MTVTVYSQDNCQQCKATERALTKYEVAHEVQKIAEHQDILDMAAERGFTSAPVVTVHKEGELVAAWSGFNLGALRELAA